MNNVEQPRLADLFARLHDIYNGSGAVLLWFTTPHKLLSGERACDLWDEGRKDEVMALVDQMETGAFV